MGLTHYVLAGFLVQHTIKNETDDSVESICGGVAHKSRLAKPTDTDYKRAQPCIDCQIILKAHDAARKAGRRWEAPRGDVE